MTIEERRHIERWKKEGKSNREVAKLLGRANEIINKEVHRGQVLQQVRKGPYQKVYSADYGQSIYQNNRKKCVRKLKLTKQLKETIYYL